MEVIKLDSVSYSYPDGTPALKDINFTIEHGEKIAILGANGAGKSTLFQLFNGLLQPSSGQVTVKGLKVEKSNLKTVRKMVGMVFQDPDDQLFSTTVKQEVSYGCLNLGMSKELIEQNVRWALTVVGLEDYEQKSPHRLSGGEKKKVALASVLAMKPDVLVLDEPTAALDPRGVANLIELLNYINQSLKITLIFATHDVDVVPLLADRVFIMNKGQIVFSGSTHKAFSQKELIRDNNLRLPRIAHLAELLQRDSILDSGLLPLTIGQAKQVIETTFDSITPSKKNSTATS